MFNGYKYQKAIHMYDNLYNLHTHTHTHTHMADDRKQHRIIPIPWNIIVHTQNPCIVTRVLEHI